MKRSACSFLQVSFLVASSYCSLHSRKSLSRNLLFPWKGFHHTLKSYFVLNSFQNSKYFWHPSLETRKNEDEFSIAINSRGRWTRFFEQSWYNTVCKLTNEESLKVEIFLVLPHKIQLNYQFTFAMSNYNYCLVSGTICSSATTVMCTNSLKDRWLKIDFFL